jgi:endonuclease/exonuclease/phosphatase family metal-dependent hydrolase
MNFSSSITLGEKARNFVAAAVAAATVSLVALLIRERRLRLRDRARVDDLIRDVVRKQPLQFTVSQYNILAGYLGDNTSPWFLYGVRNLDDDDDEAHEHENGESSESSSSSSGGGLTRRQRIFEKFYERDPTTKQLVNKGWPKYVKGILTAQEMAAVEAADKSYFSWGGDGGRAQRLLSTIERLDADILSLVECDHFHDFFLPELRARGYGGAWEKRPRECSRDGEAIFWRESKFSLVASKGVHFVDSTCPTTGKERKDRCAMFVLLKSTTHASCDHRPIYVVAVSVHLARNPDDKTQDEVRARQVAQLFRDLTHFVAAEASKLEGGEGGEGGEEKAAAALAPGNPIARAPVLLMGDLNATQFDRLKGLVLALGEITDQPVHPFLWEATDVPSRSTSVTVARDVRIDALFYPSSSLELVEAPMLPLLRAPIPDARHASDHLPVCATFRLRTDYEKSLSLARAWFVAVAVAVCSAGRSGAGTAAAAKEKEMKDEEEEKKKKKKKKKKEKQAAAAAAAHTTPPTKGEAKQLPTFVSPTFHEIFNTQTPLPKGGSSSSSSLASPSSSSSSSSSSRRRASPSPTPPLAAEVLSKASVFGTGALSQNRPLSADELSDAWVLFDWNSEHNLTIAKLRRASANLGLAFSEGLLSAVFSRLVKIAKARRKHKALAAEAAKAAANDGEGEGVEKNAAEAGNGASNNLAPPVGRTTPVIAWGEADSSDDSDSGSDSDDSSDDSNSDGDDNVGGGGGGGVQVGFAEFVVSYDMSLRTAEFEEARPDLVEAFRSFDTNGDGQIDEVELYDALTRFSPLTLTQDECRRFIRGMDIDGDVRIFLLFLY